MTTRTYRVIFAIAKKIMATPQWLLVHKRLVPSPKDSEDQFVRNTRRRHKLAVESALRKGFLKTLDADLILQSQDEVVSSDSFR